MQPCGLVSKCCSVAVKHLILWSRRVDSTASVLCHCICSPKVNTHRKNFGPPFFSASGCSSRRKEVSLIVRQGTDLLTAVTWPHTSKVGKHTSTTWTCNNPKARVSWVCLCKVLIIDGWWSVISLNCTFEPCATVSPVHRFFERKVAILKFLATTRIYLDTPESAAEWNVE